MSRVVFFNDDKSGALSRLSAGMGVCVEIEAYPGMGTHILINTPPDEAGQVEAVELWVNAAGDLQLESHTTSIDDAEPPRPRSAHQPVLLPTLVEPATPEPTMSRLRIIPRILSAAQGFLHPDGLRASDLPSEDAVVKLVPERGLPIGSLLLLFYPRQTTDVSNTFSDEGVGLRADHESVIILDPRLPPGWTNEEAADVLSRLAASYRDDSLLSSCDLEEDVES